MLQWLKKYRTKGNYPIHKKHIKPVAKLLSKK